MAFSVASWNVEFFGSRRPGETQASVDRRIDRVIQFLQQPEIASDVYAIYEVNGAAVFQRVMDAFPNHSWQITEGPGAQEILVGFSVQAFVTQRIEFTHGFGGPLRPGVVVTVSDNNHNFPMLFLHLKAAGRPIDFGVRSTQHGHVRNLRKALNNAAPAPARQANLIVAGDLNNVGLDLSFSKADISLAEELDRLKGMYSSRFDQMPVRPKTHEATFWNGPGSNDPPSDIDHVMAATCVQLAAAGGGAEVKVKGWPELATDAEMGQWIADFSDHALLRFTVTGSTATPVN